MDRPRLVRLHKAMSDLGRPYRIVFVPDPVCWTEAPETWRLLAYGLLENFGFRQFLSLAKVKALFDLAFQHREWGSMERRGFANRRRQGFRFDPEADQLPP